MINRRQLLQRVLQLGVLAGMDTMPLPSLGAAPATAEGKAFTREWLRAEAKKLSGQGYQSAANSLPRWVEQLDWDAYQSIKFRADKALWQSEDSAVQARLFHLGLYFKHPVAINEVRGGIATPIRYSEDLFTYGPRVERPKRLGDLGFAGFRVATKPRFDADVFAFLGASYFRAVGGSRQYGLSARGLAIDTAMNRPEEFPDFVQFWLEQPGPNATRVTVHALLDSPSVTGAYTFVIAPGEVTIMDVEATLYPRRNIERIGLAPLTSMFQCGENDRRVADDFRPEIHDSDGLLLWTGNGERIWRPIVNATGVRVNTFMDNNPRGFGLLQRDTNFDHYQDDGANYHLRPSLWVEPQGEWGRGAVQLAELPSADETFDNIVAFWTPQEPFAPGQERSFKYRLHWGAKIPPDAGAAEVVSTRIGAGGIPGQKDRQPSRKFVIDFKGGRFEHLPWETKVEPVITVSRGKVLEPAVRPVKGWDTWRCNFDLLAEGKDPVDLRCFLRDAQGALTETWLYQWTP